jgi:hypothetical protein
MLSQLAASIQEEKGNRDELSASCNGIILFFARLGMIDDDSSLAESFPYAFNYIEQCKPQIY